MTRTPRARPPQRAVGAAGADESPRSARWRQPYKSVERRRAQESKGEMVSIDAEAAGGGPYSLQGSSACKKSACVSGVSS